MKLLFIGSLIILLLLSHMGQAFGCDKDVTKVTQGTPAPCSGWHVSEPQMQEFAKTADKLTIEEKMNQVNKQLLLLSEVEIDFYKQRSLSQSKELQKAESKRFWATTGAFVLGVVLTGVAAKAAIESTK